MNKYWIPGPITNYGTTEAGFHGEVRVVLASEFDRYAHANREQAKEIQDLRLIRDSLGDELEAVKAECADLIAGKEYQAMQRTLGEVNARLAVLQEAFDDMHKAMLREFARAESAEARLAEAERQLKQHRDDMAYRMLGGDDAARDADSADEVQK